MRVWVRPSELKGLRSLRDEVVVFGYSAGGPSAIDSPFATGLARPPWSSWDPRCPVRRARHPSGWPEPCSGSDAFFWLVRRLMPTQLGRLMGVPAGLRRAPNRRSHRRDAAGPSARMVQLSWG